MFTSGHAIRDLHARFCTVGVTGTNGKTTTTSMIAAIVGAAGQLPVRVTTVGTWIGETRRQPDTDLAAFLRTADEAWRAGARTLAVEATSRALAAGFARHWPARIGVFTNLTRDHLDRHGSPEAYLAAKAQLFAHLPPGGAAVLNARDPASVLLEHAIPAHVQRLWYAVGEDGEHAPGRPLGVLASRARTTRAGTEIALEPAGIGARLGPKVCLRVLGRVNAENALGAALAAHALGLPFRAIREGLETFSGVEGRFEVIVERPTVVVDYAHTPDALGRTLETARELAGARGAVLCVFGCGGERDAGKRPIMGAIADGLADRVFVTSDNPRREDPAQIVAAICASRRGGAEWRVELDRARAIDAAVREAGPDDVVVVAGRGHERIQDLGLDKRELRDADVVREAARRCGHLPRRG